MKKTEKGDEYEEFVSKIYNAILKSDNFVVSKTIQIERKKKIKDRSGINREFDIYWEYELGGLVYKTIIECKDFNKKIPIDKIDSLIGKLKDLPDLKAVFATKLGYQRGAEKKAINHNIELLIVREQNDTDWKNEEGLPYLRSLNIDLMTKIAAKIIDFIPVIDLNWLKANTQYNESNIPPISGLNDQVFIIDNSRGEKYSLYDLQNRLSKNESGEFIEIIDFEDCFLQTPEYKFKIKSYQVKFQTYKSMITPIEIDFSNELIGVVEYINRNEKMRIFKK
ncbi:hypothetical protein [Leptospira mtsangambouensis]|uniref:hypothetical protein n=1 Tax=Leptospira mtsangambouensis TaxID=2484912 RepID=UPI001EEA62E2|nr:hypothetical protein [Leptospira mtsangambouensis]MCG6142746.1 hypothetical protein [Leptospira mtsangambouensis]